MPGTTATTTDAPELGRLLALERRVDAGACERAEPHPLGLVLRTPSLASFWALNSLLVERPRPGLDDGALTRELERLYGADATLRAVVTDEATGERLAAAAAPLEATREVVMVQRRAPDRAPQPGVARAAGEEELRAAEAALLRDDGLDATTAAIVQAGRARMRAAAPAVVRAVAAADGRDVATATVYHDGFTALIADVATLRAARGRGLARAAMGVCADAARAAGCDVVGLTADAEDWPRELYAKLGFVVVGHIWSFMRV
ncbi:MAG TPA: GNAT family N-acetyltransferase [Solirubrobacteraceae bacterium]|nr:GNAT family N-acetyltransferase [Solirubrobacteraceae bacterium]